MEHSIPLHTKPHPKLSVTEWSNNIYKLKKEARFNRFESYQLRNLSNQLRNETAVTTKWDYNINNDLLRERIFEVETWREKQRFQREKVRDEMNALKEEKRNTELLLEHLQIPFMVVSQCLANRDQRLPSELTRDVLGEELQNENQTIEKHKKILTDLCYRGWECEKELTNILCQLEREIRNKDETIALDTCVKDLDRECSNISFKVDPTRKMPGTLSEVAYDNHIQNTINLSECLMRDSKQLRENMSKARELTQNELYAQSQKLEMVMRKRIFEVQRAKNEMEWQKMKLESNLAKVESEINRLQDALQDKTNPAKVVETRLEMRTRRPDLERVDDKPFRGLIEEFDRVNFSRRTLEEKLKEALRTYHAMSSHYERVKRDLHHKNHALETDRRLIEIRKPLHQSNETDYKRNVGYCNLSNELVGD